MINIYIFRWVDGANHAGLAMVVLVLRAVEGDWIGVLDGHGEGWLVGGLASVADEETGVESTVGLAGGAAGSTAGGDGVVLEDDQRVSLC